MELIFPALALFFVLYCLVRASAVLFVGHQTEVESIRRSAIQRGSRILTTAVVVALLLADWCWWMWADEGISSAAHSGDLEAVRTYLRWGASVDSTICGDLPRPTPLIYAIQNNDPKMVRFLLDRGANPNKTDPDGKRPMDWAIRGRNNDIIDSVRRAGGRPTKHHQMEL